jgi:hypothetical protein
MPQCKYLFTVVGDNILTGQNSVGQSYLQNPMYIYVPMVKIRVSEEEQPGEEHSARVSLLRYTLPFYIP